MTQTLTRDEVRRLDRLAIEIYGLPGIVLMENAGRGAAELLAQRIPSGSGPVCLCCGRGNNGGDGFVMARHLPLLGIETEILIFDDPASFSPDAALNFAVCQRLGLPIRSLLLPEMRPELEERLQRAAWIVDALLGTGARGAPHEKYALIVDCLNDSQRPIFAVDIPTGLDCDTGLAAGACAQVSLTATFAANKPAFETDSGRSAAGEVVVVSIGIPADILSRNPSE